MEEHNELIESLKPVFNACDFNGDGYVKIQDLLSLGKQHGVEDVEELESILVQLDPDGNGKVTFADFCHRVQEIISLTESGSNSPTPPEDPPPRQRSYTDSEGFFDDPDSPTHSTASTNDYYGDLDDLAPPLIEIEEPHKHRHKASKHHLSIYSTYPLNGIHKGKRKYPSLFQNKLLTLSRTSEHQSQEEGFEAFGERSDGDDTASYYSDYSSPEKEKPHLLKKRLSGTLAARKLRMVQSAHTSLHNSMEELNISANHYPYSDSESNMYTLSSQIEKLSSQVSLLQIEQADHEDKQHFLREQNKKLMSRINHLEEQLHDQKTATADHVEEHSSKYKHALTKLQRENEKTLEELQSKLKQAESEIDNLKVVEPMLRKELELCLEERRIVQQKVEELQGVILEKETEIVNLRVQLKKKNEDLERIRIEREQEVAELTQELESLRHIKNTSMSQFDHTNELIQQIESLKQENDRIKNSKDDLREQLLQHRNILDSQNQESLADELLSADKDDVLTALREQEKNNHRMQQYIDQLLMIILENDPSLLEKG